MAETRTEDELESFRQQWRSEVGARSKASASKAPARPKPAHSGQGRPSFQLPKPTEPGPAVAEGDGWSYHDLEDKEACLTLQQEHDRPRSLPSKEPRSALEHYEKAVEREGQGSLGDSVGLYRRAFKLDSSVQEAYKRKHYPQPPPNAPKSVDPNPSNASSAVPNTAHHSLHGGDLTLADLIEEFSQLSIPGAEPETDLSPPPPCPIANLPEEILSQILRNIALIDVAILPKIALSCKRLAFLVMTEDSIWKDTALGQDHGISGMHYQYACNLRAKPFSDDDHPPIPPMKTDLTPSVYPNYRAQLRQRPRVRFGGCYISTVNYTRPGGASATLSTWNNPVHIVTYYRYLRFFRDGSCISLLTTTEPTDTVHHLTRNNVHQHHTGAMPSVVMKDALLGRWRLSGTERKPEDEEQLEEPQGPGEYVVEPTDFYEAEEEGDVHVETEGVISKYMWKMQFSLGSSGRKDGTRNNKLSWKGFWSYNRLTDDWGEFHLKHDRAFYWSRVKSYAV